MKRVLIGLGCLALMYAASGWTAWRWFLPPGKGF